MIRVQLMAGVLVAALALAGCSNDEPAHPSGGDTAPGKGGSAAGGGASNDTSGSGGSGAGVGAGAGAGAGGAAAGSDSSACVLAKEPGAVVVLDCATKVTFTDSGGGFRPVTPAGSECNGERTFSLTFATRELTWSLCDFAQNAPWRLDNGMRTLDAGELAAALPKLHEITVHNGQGVCGADKGLLTIQVETAQESQQYNDSFYSCLPKPDVIYVDNIDSGFVVLLDLAHE